MKIGTFILSKSLGRTLFARVRANEIELFEKRVGQADATIMLDAEAIGTLKDVLA